MSFQYCTVFQKELSLGKKITMTLELEISSENDLQLFLSLAKRLKIKSNTVEDKQTSIYESLTWKQVAERLEKAEKQTGITMKAFVSDLEKWN